MAGLKGLSKAEVAAKKGEQTDIEDFINGAKQRVDKLAVKPTRPRNYERYVFSLTPQYSKNIDKMAQVPVNFRANRSDVVKAGLILLGELNDFELAAAIRKAQIS